MTQHPMTAMLLRLFLLFSIIECSGSIAFDKLLGTNEYAVVGVADCHIVLQTNFSSCPPQLTLKQRHAGPCPKIISVLYLPPEKQSIIAPMVMTFFPASGNYIGFNMQSIPKQDESRNYVGKSVDRSSFSYLPNGERILFDNIFGIVYNHLSAELFVLHRSAGQIKPNVTVYLMVADSKSHLRPVLLSSLEIHENFLYTHWSSDPYSETFYYHKHEINEYLQCSKLYSIPYDSLLVYLKTGNTGYSEKDFGKSPVSPRRDFVHVTNGLMFSYDSSGNRTHFIASLHRNIHANRCFSFLTQPYQFYVLTGWEYCKIRDESSANYTTCTQFLEQKSADTMNTSFLWAITGAVIINAIILLVILCVVCKRRESDLLDNDYYVHHHSKSHPTLITPDEMYERRRLRSSVTDF
uniref:Uncharacterized protein n=1 Tax=Panagrolaimus sp. JU765 TaxID=591449 RepID=A0AC34PVL4_9BILA